MSEFQSKGSIYDKSVLKPRGQVALSSFSFIFSEMLQYFQFSSHSVSDLERKLEETGYSIGQRMSELIGCRERLSRRETRIISMLKFINSTVWKHMFNKEADNLESSVDNEDEYMIYEQSPITNTFVSVPDDMGSFNCAAFIAGILSGIMDSVNFDAKVTAHTIDEGQTQTTVFLVKFSKEVMAREARMG
jgi:trafficking protein particle complex subunit 5